jgi:hypothetical protein
LGDINNPTINYFYIKDKYPEYIFSAYHSDKTVTDHQRVISKTPPEKFTQLDGNITDLSFDGKKLVVAATGSHDFLVAGGYCRSGYNTINRWDVYSSSGDLKIILPNIPSPLSDVYWFPSTARFQFDYVNFVNYSVIQNYGDFINFRFRSNERIESKFKEYNSKSITQNPSSGRINIKEIVHNTPFYTNPFNRETF